MTQKGITYNSNIDDRVQIKGVIFDLDDTLYSQKQFVISGFKQVARYIESLYNIDIYNDLCSLFQEGYGSSIFYSTLKKHFNYVEESLARKLLYIHRTHAPEIELYPEAKVCLAQLIGQDIRVSVLTDGQASIQKRKIEALQLDPLLDAIVYCDDLIGSQPSLSRMEDALQILALQMELDFSELVFVGDNPILDFYVPKQLGMGTIRIHRSSSEHANDQPPTNDHAPHISIDSLCFLADILQTADFSV